MRFSGHAQVYDHDDSLLAASWLRKGFLQCGVYHPNLTLKTSKRGLLGWLLSANEKTWLQNPMGKDGIFPLIFEQVS